MSSSINAETRLYAVLGNPVHHSLSPLIHNELFKKWGLNAVYMAFEVEPHSLGLAFEAIRSLGIRGVNLTIPFKEVALDFIDEIPEDIDRCVGALNTVVNRKGQLFGHNTDVPGFLFALKDELHFNPEAKTVLVLGAGGAARAVAFALAYAHAEKIYIHNRTLARAEGLQSYLTQHFPETEIEAVESLDVLSHERLDLIVNASAVGLRNGDLAPVDLKRVGNSACVYDLIYSPRETQLLKDAKKMGFPSANGLGMLAAQAALSFELWTEKKEGVREAMLEVLKNAVS